VKHRLVFVALLGTFTVACKRETPPPAIQLVSEPPVAAPATLTAEGTLRDPDAFWSRIRAGGGPSLTDAPSTAAGALLLVAGCDPTLGSLISGAEPFYVAIGDAPKGTAFAIAMKIQDFAAAQSALAGADAGYRGEQVGGMLHLVPLTGSEPVAVGVTGSGYLVLASSVDDLGTLGAYAARTLPTKASPSASLELRMVPAALDRTGAGAPALAAKLVAVLAAGMRGSLPPEVDAQAVAACFTSSIETAAASFGDLAEARVDVTAEDAEVHATATLVPKPGDNSAKRRVSAMHPGDVTPLLTSPRDALASFFWSDTAADRASDVKTIGPCIGRALGAVLGNDGESKLDDVLGSWARGRGDWETMAIVTKGPAAGLIAQAPVANGEDLSHALRSFVSLAAQPSVQDAIRRFLPPRAGALETVEVPRVGKVSVMMFNPTLIPSHSEDAAPEVSTMAPPGLAWLVGAKEVDLGLGFSPQALIGFTHPVDPLGADALTSRAVHGIREGSFAAVFRPPGCCGGGRPGAGPLTVAWGRAGTNASGSLAVGDELVGILAGRAAGH